MRLIGFLPLVLVIGCGDNKDDHHHPPDAKVADAAVDGPTPLTCAYNEMSDATNDELFNAQTSSPEMTGQSFTKAFQLCGKLDNNWAQNTQRIDSDTYQFTVPAASSAIVYLVAPGAQDYDTVILDITSTPPGLFATGEYTGNFAVASLALPPGDYYVTVTAYDATAPAAALDYKLNVMIDSPTRCAKSTMAATFTEASDGLTADGNDVYEVRYSGQPRRKLTDNTLDTAEQTGITAAVGSTYRITGTSAAPAVAPASWADSFQDRDTYMITTGATTNQLGVRLNWPGTTADFDFFIFPMNEIIEIANGWKNGNMEDEFVTISVLPSTQYLIWTAMDDASTGVDLRPRIDRVAQRRARLAAIGEHLRVEPCMRVAGVLDHREQR